MLKTKVALCSLAVLVAVAAACSQSTPPASNSSAANSQNKGKSETKTVEQAQTPQVAAISGKDLYTVNCMTCHKDSGKGGKVTVDGKTMNPDDLTSANMKAKSDEKLYAYVADGIEDEGMPAFKDRLKPDEIKAVVAHMRTLQGK